MNEEQLPQQEQEKEPFVPSPVSRRIWAWMGIVYAVIIMLLITYWISTTHFITGATGLMLFPLFGALCAQGINNYFRCKRGERDGKPSLLLASALCMGAVSLSLLALGVVQLIAFFEGM